jgi:hypothetical protein
MLTVCEKNFPALMFLYTDLNSMPAIDDILPHLNDNDRNVKMAPDRIRGRYNTGPIPPDYYYEDSQEGKLHAHGLQDSHQPHHNHPVQGEQESTVVGATPIKVCLEDRNYKNVIHVYISKLCRAE